MGWEIELYKKENGEIPVLEFQRRLPPKHRAKSTYWKNLEQICRNLMSR